jgi:uncharacterized protein (UPF0305 family)
MTKMAASVLKGIPGTYTYTYRTEDGSTITLNMGKDIDTWKQVAKQAKKSPNREEKRKWLRALHKVLVEELKAVVADDNADEVFKGRCRALLGRIEISLTPQERFAVYLAKGVRRWVGSDLRRMTKMAASQLRGIPQTYTYTYRTEDGSTITLNMGQDIKRWKKVAKQAKKSRKREEKRKWVRALHEVLVKELKAVVADEADVSRDAVRLRERCQAMLGRIPDPY